VYVPVPADMTEPVSVSPIILPVDTIDLKMCCQEGWEAVKLCNGQLGEISDISLDPIAPEDYP